MRRTGIALLTLILALPLVAAESKPPGTDVAAATRGMQKIDGYVPLYWDAGEGKLLMEVPHLDQELLMQVSLPAGIGSNPIGLDRNQLGGTHVVSFRRIGPKLLMVEPNYRYRALTGDVAEQQAVANSFAESVLWGFPIVASEGERVLVDATPFFVRDAHGVADQLKETKQGSYTLDDSRSAVWLPQTKAFPKNTEVEVLLTFVTSGNPGRLVQQVTPSPKAITVREHYSLVELPPPGYHPRAFDPRVGVYGVDFYDFASPLTAPIEKRWITRFRLEKKDPGAAVSEPVKPIVYYLDPGTPEPVRSALLDGISWWNQAFEAAGFRNAFQVKMLPPGADPMDLRYNVITWVHRSTRGWSYGANVVDPRTGEILKGNVSLGSLRVRQDFLIGEGLVPLFEGVAAPSDGDALAAADPSIDAKAMALARLRQLGAHEVGHTIGLAHNFAASTYGRASVMDYPAPMVEIRNGKLDLSNAYARGIGAYDEFAIAYAYTQFPPGTDEHAALEKLVEDAIHHGMLFITDEDARPAGAAHPLASLWDNGADPVAMLRHEMDVRRIAMNHFGEGNLQPGMPMSQLEAEFLPLYLHHRYQLQAAVKSLGGLFYTYSVRTPNGPVPSDVRHIVPAATQRDALAAVLDTVSVDSLRIPTRILKLIPPVPFGWEGGPTERFPSRTDPVFDPIGAASIAADLAVSGVLEPHRAARLIEFHAQDAQNPGFEEVVKALVDRTWSEKVTDSYGDAIARAVQRVTVDDLMGLAANEDAASDVRAIATDALRRLGSDLQ
ncbi:MAG: zinc-dependent metalloprotease, partial [Thermoanaerobaculia bacterium]